MMHYCSAILECTMMYHFLQTNVMLYYNCARSRGPRGGPKAGPNGGPRRGPELVPEVFPGGGPRSLPQMWSQDCIPEVVPGFCHGRGPRICSLLFAASKQVLAAKLDSAM